MRNIQITQTRTVKEIYELTFNEEYWDDFKINWKYDAETDAEKELVGVISFDEIVSILLGESPDITWQRMIGVESQLDGSAPQPMYITMSLASEVEQYINERAMLDAELVDSIVLEDENHFEAEEID